MRKIAIILLGLMLGWFCSNGVMPLVDPISHSMTTQASIDSSDREEQCCERVCNSDLGMTRFVPEFSARTLSIRTISCPDRLGVRCGVLSGRYGERIGNLPEFTFHLFYAGSRVVDYYVYRLRRLLI